MGPTTHVWCSALSLPQFPPELPVSRWAVASLLNRMKKKESSIFLVRASATLVGLSSRLHDVAGALAPRGIDA